MLSFYRFITEAAAPVTLYHVTRTDAATSILAHGFSLDHVVANWPFDYAVSCHRRLADARRHAHGVSSLVILAFTFTGRLAFAADVERAGLGNPADGFGGPVKDPRAYRRKALAAGIDALAVPHPQGGMSTDWVIDPSAPINTAYVYNLDRIRDVRIVR